MVPMSYHSWREKLGNYLQIKVMLSDSSPHKYTTSVRYFGRQRQIFWKAAIKSKAKKRTATQIEVVALFLTGFFGKQIDVVIFLTTINAVVKFNRERGGKRDTLNHEVLAYRINMNHLQKKEAILMHIR